MSILTTPILPSGIPEFPVRRFSVEEYHQMAAQGILSDEENVELLEGWITPKMIRTPPHDVSVTLVHRVLERLISPGFHLRVQAAVTTADSEPEPDVSIVRGDVRDYTSHHPGKGDVVLVVEVAESSLARDRRKRRMYARAEFPAYWIVNLVEGRVEVHGDPVASEEPPRYDTELIYQPAESFSLTIDGAEIGQVTARDLLP